MPDTLLSFRVRLGPHSIDASYPVPAEAVPAAELLPVLQDFTNRVVEFAEQGAGAPISCRAGCGACCRQPVPIAEPEALAIADLAAALPAERRARVEAGFETAMRRLRESGLAERLRPGGASTESRREAGLAYFALGIPCPFLENESCSIHMQRPLACREYLVTTPAANCSDPHPETIRTIDLAARPSASLQKLEAGQARWLLLIEALEWARENAGRPRARRSGPEWVRGFLEGMSKK